MSALSYLLLTRFKNSIKQFFKKPAKLILVIVMAALFGLLIFTGGSNETDIMDSRRSINELFAGVFVFYFIIFMLNAATGLSNGASFFSMADVNNVFIAPISQRRVLIYGLVRQLGTTFWMAFFIIYQYGWLGNLYGVTLSGLFALLIGYMLVVFCAQLVAMGIYSYSSCDDRKKAFVKRILLVASIAVLLLCAGNVFSAQDKLGALVKGVNQSFVSYIPIAGWLRAAVVGVMSGNYFAALLGVGATVGFVMLFAAVIIKTDSDYYEDVLAATEVSYSAISAQKEGRVAEQMPRNVKVGKSGIGKGKGASVFFYKHLIESRRSKVFLLDTVSILFVVISVIFGYFMRENGILPGLAFSCYLLIFGSFNARWVKEMTYPYIYMAPVSPFKKLVATCAESVLKMLLESVVSFVVLGILIEASPIAIALSIFVRTAFGILFIASNVLTDKLFGGLGKGMQLMVFFLLLILIAVPGIVGAVLIAGFAGLNGSLALVGTWFLVVSVLILFLCRNILSNAEFNYSK